MTVGWEVEVFVGVGCIALCDVYYLGNLLGISNTLLLRLFTLGGSTTWWLSVMLSNVVHEQSKNHISHKYLEMRL